MFDGITDAFTRKSGSRQQNESVVRLMQQQLQQTVILTAGFTPTLSCYAMIFKHFYGRTILTKTLLDGPGRVLESFIRAF